MLLTPLAMTAGAQTLKDSLIESTPTENKITSELSTYLESIDNDEYVKIYVWLNDYGEDMLYQVLSKRLGATITAETEENYIVSKISAKKQFLKEGLERLSKSGEYNTLSTIGKIEAKSLSADDFRAQALIPEVMTDTEIQTCLESQMTSDEIISLSERTQFLKDYRATRKALNTSVNDTFYQKLNLNKCKNVYLDQALAYAELECPKSYVENLESMDIVNQIGLYQEVEFFTDYETFKNEEIDTRGISGNYYHMTPHETLGYNGAGIKVGILEQTGIYDQSSPHIEDKIINTNVASTSNFSLHATTVLSILAGDSVLIGIEKYQGIAPNASLYYSNLKVFESYDNKYSAAINWFVSNNVSVLNMSFGVFYKNRETQNYVFDYQTIDNIVDQYVIQYRLVIIKSAGNTSDEVDENGNYILDENGNRIIRNDINVTNPGLSYNVITIGNVDITTNNGKSAMNSSSCYEEDSYLSNKPELSAFGTRIAMCGYDDNGILKLYHFGSGTSFAAPMVAGTAALIMQANSDLIGEPTAIKAILMNGADEEAIYYNDIETANVSLDNELVTLTPSILNENKISVNSTILREKSGAGLLNIPASIRMAQSKMFYPIMFDYSPYGFVSEKYIFNAGTMVEVGMVYEKFTDEILTSKYVYDLNLQILDSTGAVIFESADTTNNVELYKCTFKQTGTYQFKIIASSQDIEPYVGMAFTSLIISCACNEKLLSQGACSSASHAISCSNQDCGFSCNEIHHVVHATKTLSNGMPITCTIYYCPQKFVSSVPPPSFNYYEMVFSVTTPNGYTFHGVMPAGSNVTQTSVGEIRRLTFEAIIEAPNGNVSFVVTPTFTITIDYYEQTVTIS
ncbi:MAG: S8 family serine peptidase [Clostridia bacterium]|nr:S8 family serine peptidase [Clostridia bacterium]